MPHLNSIHQELAQLTQSGGSHPGLDALRPLTPDGWAQVHGNITPTPDVQALQVGAGWVCWFDRLSVYACAYECACVCASLCFYAYVCVS